MLHFTMKNVLSPVTLLVTMGYASIASANSQTGALGSAASATDIYQVTCSTNASGVTDYLQASIADNPPVQAPLLSVMIFKDGKAINSTDSKDGDTAYSPFVQLHGGDGVYTLFIRKTDVAPEMYTLAFNCKSASNVNTGMSIKTIQNQ